MRMDQLAKLSALAGIGMMVVGGVMLYRQQKAKGLLGGLGRANPRLIPKGTPQAAVVGRYSDGKMNTEVRMDDELPIEQRLSTIQDLIYKSVQDPEMRRLALQITADCPERDGMCEARAIYDAVKKRVRYTGDVSSIKLGKDGPVDGIDLYQSARRTWEFKGGDCDDQAIVIATLLSLNGIEARLRVSKEDKASDWSHIYPVAGLPKLAPTKWVALDTTLPGRDKFSIEVPFADAVDFPA